MCPETIAICMIGDWTAILEVIMASISIGIVLGAVVGIVYLSLNRK